MLNKPIAQTCTYNGKEFALSLKEADKSLDRINIFINLWIPSVSIIAGNSS